MIIIKGSILGYGGILVLLILTSAVIIWITATGPASTVIATKEGNIISFRNDVELLTKNLEQGIEFISQKSAYTLAKNGGNAEGSQIYWTSLYPRIDVLERNLEDKIKDSLLPSEYIKNNREVNWEESIIDVNYNLCGPISLSKCFFVDGNRYLNIYDKNIDSGISINQSINSSIDSSYFKLLNAGRAIMEDSQFNQYLNDSVALLNALYVAKAGGDLRFSNLDFSAYVKNETDGDVVTFFIAEYCYPPNDYCLAPLAPYDNAITEEFHSEGDVNWDGVINKEDEKIFNAAYESKIGFSNWNSACDFNGDLEVNSIDFTIYAGNFGRKSPPYIIDPANGNQIPYDYVRLKFQYKEEQTGTTISTFDFNIETLPNVGSIRSGDYIETFIKVNRLSTVVNPVHLTYSITPDPGTISISLGANDQNPTYSSKMSITTTTMTDAGVYTITVTGTGGTITRTATYVLTVNPSMFFALNINPNAKTIDIGETTTTDVTVTLTGGSASQVVLDEINNPSNVTRNFNLNNQPPNYASTLTMRDIGGVSGTYVLKVRGRGGGSTVLSPDYTLTVAPPFQFEINLGSYLGTVIPGQSITIPSEVTYRQGISKNVQLTSSVSLVLGSGDPTKISVLFSTSSGTPTFPFSMTIGTPSDRLNGRFAIVVNGDGGGFHNDKTYTLNIVVPACYVDSDCDDSNACTGVLSEGKIDKCRNGGTLSASCDRPALPAGTLPNGNVCGTDSANCPDQCSGGTQYRNGYAQSCYRTCDGTGRTPPTGCQACTPPTSSCALTSAYYGSITSCGTNSANCPDRCSSAYEYRNGVTKTCNRVCADAVNCQASCTPDTSPTACPLTSASYGSITSCGTSSATCPDICSSSIEYRNGGTVSCNRQCANAVSCSGSCTVPACTAANYGSSKTCRFNCQNAVNCWGGKACTAASCADSGMLCNSGESCTFTAGCYIVYASECCYYKDFYWPGGVGCGDGSWGTVVCNSGYGCDGWTGCCYDNFHDCCGSCTLSDACKYV